MARARFLLLLTLASLLLLVLLARSAAAAPVCTSLFRVDGGARHAEYGWYRAEPGSTISGSDSGTCTASETLQIPAGTTIRYRTNHQAVAGEHYESSSGGYASLSLSYSGSWSSPFPGDGWSYSGSMNVKAGDGRDGGLVMRGNRYYDVTSSGSVVFSGSMSTSLSWTVYGGAYGYEVALVYEAYYIRETPPSPPQYTLTVYVLSLIHI